MNKCPSGVCRECAVTIGDRRETGAKTCCLGRTHCLHGSSATTSKPPRSSFNLNSPLTPSPRTAAATHAYSLHLALGLSPHRSARNVVMTAEVQRAAAPVQRLEATYSFGFSDFLRREYRFGLDPDRPACKAYLQGHCPLGSRCPDKHHVSSSYSKCVTPVTQT